jgi:hypothetical protein
MNGSVLLVQVIAVDVLCSIDRLPRNVLVKSKLLDPCIFKETLIYSVIAKQSN